MEVTTGSQDIMVVGSLLLTLKPDRQIGEELSDTLGNKPTVTCVPTVETNG